MAVDLQFSEFTIFHRIDYAYILTAIFENEGAQWHVQQHIVFLRLSGVTDEERLFLSTRRLVLEVVSPTFTFGLDGRFMEIKLASISSISSLAFNLLNAGPLPVVRR